MPLTGPFTLVYLVFNTLFGLLTQDRQAECFRGVARMLAPGGRFVIECFVPDVTRFDRGQRVQARAVTEDSATIEVSRHDAVDQRVTTQDITFDAAGLTRAERYAGWERQPFVSSSGQHVSVYRRA